MGNGAATSSAGATVGPSSLGWFGRALGCCAEDDHLSLGLAWEHHYSACPLDDAQWGKLFAAAAGHGALGCLELLLQVCH